MFQDVDLLNADLYLSRGQVRILGVLRTLGDFARHEDDVFASESPAGFEDGFVTIAGEDDLCLAVPITEIDEERAAEIAIGVDPTAQDHFLTDMLCTKFTASMRSKQCRNLYYAST